MRHSHSVSQYFAMARGDVVELAGDEALDAVVEEDAADARLRLALRQLEARVLELDQRLAEGRPLLHVSRRDGHRLLGRCDRASPPR